MPSRKRRSSQPATQGGDTSVVENKNPAVGASNAEAQEELRGKKGTDAGLANYEQALGKWLGPELYKAVAPHLTLDAIAGYANDGLQAALEGSVGALDGLEGEVDKAALDKFGKALSAQYGDLAGKWVEGSGADFGNAIGDWVDAHPRVIVGVALLAAAGAILADADIPTLKQKFKIADGLTAKLEADLGSLRGIALEKIGAELAYASGPLSAAVKIEHAKDGKSDLTGKAEASLGDEEKKISADATFTEKGIEVVGVKGLYKTGLGDVEAGAQWDLDKDPTLNASLTRKDGKTTAVTGIDYDANSGVLNFKDSRSFVAGEDGPTVKTTTQTNSAGESSADLSVKGGVGDNASAWGAAGMAVDKDGKQSGTVSGGFDYADKEKGLNASASAKFGTNGDFDMNGKFNADLGGGLKGGASTSFASKNGEESFQAGGFLDYADKEGDRTRGSYNFNSNNNEHKFGVMHEETLSDRVKLRGTGNLKMSDLGTAYDASIHGAYRFNKDVAGIAGGRFETGYDGKSTWIPEVGVQVKDVPLTVGYDTRNKSVRVGLTFKF